MPSDLTRRSFGRWVLVALMAVCWLSPPRLMAQKADGEKAGEERSDNGLKMKLCWCPKGTFEMGDTPQVDVTLTRGCWMGKYEVTQKEWQSVMGKYEVIPKEWQSASWFEGLDRPVESVEWVEATAFCQRLTPIEKDAGRLPTGWEYRLPTEAQWEYACRAGTTTVYSFGDKEEQLGDYAWYVANSGRKTHPVGGKKPNAWGLHDMHGNVWEWCRDSGLRQLPGGSDPEVKEGSFRVYRGGCWRSFAAFCQSAFRLRNHPLTGTTTWASAWP